MTYIGSEPNYGALHSQTITTANGSTATFTLDQYVPDSASIIVTVGNVVQEPTTAYTASGNSITFTENVPNGDTIVVRYLGRSIDVPTTYKQADRFKFVATNAQTTFSGADANSLTLAYTTGNIDVFLNGVRLDESDYTASNGTSVVLGSGASTSDELVIIAYRTIQISNALDKTAGGTVTGATTFNAQVNVISNLLVTSEATSGYDPILRIKRNQSDTAQNNDPLGQLDFAGKNDAEEEVNYFRMRGKIKDASDGTEDGQMVFKVMTNGTNTDRITIEGGQPIELDGGVDINGGDLTVDTSTLKVDSSNNRVGIGTTSPSSLLHVNSASGNSAVTFQTANNGSSVSSNYTTPNRTYYTGVDIGGVNSAYTIYDGNASAERMRIDSSGNVGIGASPESAVKLEVNAGSDGAVAISGRSDGGNGNNRRFNIIPFSSNGTYGGGLRLQTRNTSNVFHTAVEYISNQQEIFHGNYRTCDDKNKFGNGRYWYTGTESGNFSNAGSGVANAQTMTNYLNYQGMQIVCVKVYYNSDSSLMHETFATVCNQYHNSGVATQHSHNGTGIIDSVSLSLTGGYNTRRLVVTLDPASGYTGNNYTYSVTYGYNLN